MSARAAWRLEQWGFTDVYDYVGGKQDWLAFGFQREGEGYIAADALRTEVATCTLDSTVGDVRVWATDAQAGPLVVLGPHRVVMGTVDADTLEHADADTPIADVMREGPTTVRPSEELSGLLDRMEHAEVETVLVTTSAGEFLGMLDRQPAARVVAAQTHNGHSS